MTKQENVAGQFLVYNSKNFQRLNKELDLKWSMRELGKPFRRAADQKIYKKQEIKVKMPHVNKKPLKRKRNLFQTKNYASKELWMDWENHLKNPIQKIEKTVKIRVKLPHVKKSLARKQIFVQIPFSHTTLK